MFSNPLNRFISVLVLLLCATKISAAPPLPAPPQLSANSYVMMDFNSGRIIAESNPDERVEPASLTKMMTGYVVASELQQGTIKLTDEVVISEKAWRMEGSRMFIEVNKRVLIEDLLKGLIIQSGNDAAVALAEHIAGSEESFSGMMNDFAQKLGMSGSSFVNATGLPHPDHYTTARDMALLAKAVIQDYPQEYALYAEKEFSYADIRQFNRNKLLWRDKSVDGIKTGHTQAAGYCLVASAERNGMRLITVLLGSNSEKARTEQSQRLLNYGFRFYTTNRVFSAGQTVKQVRIWKGDSESLPLGVLQDVYVTVPRGRDQELQTELTLLDSIEAPARVGQSFGKSRIKLGDEIIAEANLVALTQIGEGSLFQKAKDTVLQYFQ